MLTRTCALPRALRGFSLVELMIAITIMALLMMAGAPALSTYMANGRVRATAESFAVGLQAARTEAVRQNRPVEFVLTSTPEPTAANVGSVTASSTGRAWVVRFADPVGSTTYTFVEAKSEREGSGSGTTSRVGVSATRGGTAVSTIEFRAMGDTSLTAPVAISVTHVGMECALQDGTGGPIRCLDVRVSPGGRVQVCDPAAPVGESRSCV